MRSSPWIVGALAVLVFACSKPPEKPVPTAAPPPVVDSAEHRAEWVWLQQTKKSLDLKREEIASLRDQALTGAAVAPQIDAINREIAALGDEFGRRLTDFINADFPVPGQPLKPEQLAAIRMKSADDLLIAREHIERTGDYAKAIEIYTAALGLDPDNGDLEAALRDARTKRYVTPERFAAVRKGMTQGEVVKVLGRPLAKDVRDFPEKKVTAWFYEKNEAGEKAGVFFNDKKLVYAADFNAVRQSERPTG